MKNKAVFLDRDGTLIQERGHIGTIRQVRFIKGTFKALKQLSQKGYKLVIVSNQSGVARGILSQSQVKKVNRYILETLSLHDIKIDALYYCPHHPRYGNGSYKKKCTCRKPAAGMAKTAQKKLNLSLRKCYVIGDKLTDIEMAQKIKAKGILVLTGFGKEQWSEADNHSGRPDFLAKNILDAVNWIVSHSKHIT
jgi:D-glycero-D-manno-heptose 1,7-bisphosphate phosphatase